LNPAVSGKHFETASAKKNNSQLRIDDSAKIPFIRNLEERSAETILLFQLVTYNEFSLLRPPERSSLGAGGPK
jgi:hypothetical protein